MPACIIQHCPNEGRKRSPYCSACASSFRYAQNKGPGWVVLRQGTLEKWQDRIQYLGTERNKKEFGHVARKVASRRATA